VPGPAFTLPRDPGVVTVRREIVGSAVIGQERSWFQAEVTPKQESLSLLALAGLVAIRRRRWFGKREYRLSGLARERGPQAVLDGPVLATRDRNGASMRIRHYAGIIVLMTSQAALAGTITNGDASLNIVGPPVWSSNLGNGTLLTDTGATDQLYQYCWYFRGPTNNQNRYFSYSGSPTETWSGSTATITYTNVGPSSWDLMNATFVIKLLDGPSPDQVQVTCDLTASNPTTHSLTWQFFNLLELNLNGQTSGYTSMITNVNEARGTFSLGSNYGEFLGVGATRYQAGQASTIRGYFNGGAYDLTNAVGPYNGNGAVAYQWSVTLAPGGSTTIRSGFSINRPAITSVECEPADTNCSGSVTLADDLGPFISLLLGQSSPCSSCAGDMNGDHVVDGADIQGFVERLLQ
jgi:hypothetical protein